MKFVVKKINFNFFYNYLSPIYGIFKIYVNSFKYKNICYLNFLPLWNFIIFLFLPKKTILGPITGSVYKSKIRDLNSLCRKYIIPILYNISLLIINKKKKLIFPTSILEKIVRSKKNTIITSIIILSTLSKEKKLFLQRI